MDGANATIDRSIPRTRAHAPVARTSRHGVLKKRPMSFVSTARSRSLVRRVADCRPPSTRSTNDRSFGRVSKISQRQIARARAGGGCLANHDQARPIRAVWRIPHGEKVRGADAEKISTRTREHWKRFGGARVCGVRIGRFGVFRGGVNYTRNICHHTHSRSGGNQWAALAANKTMWPSGLRRQVKENGKRKNKV